MKEIVERFVEETGKFDYVSFMDWCYNKFWEVGLDVVDDHLYQEEVKLLLEIYKTESKQSSR